MSAAGRCTSPECPGLLQDPQESLRYNARNTARSGFGDCVIELTDW